MQMEGRAHISRASAETGMSTPACCIPARGCCSAMGKGLFCISIICACTFLLTLDSVFLGQINHSKLCHVKLATWALDNSN